VIYLCVGILITISRELSVILIHSPSHLNELTYLFFQTDPIGILGGPITYLYTKSFFEEKTFSKAQFLLFCLPSFIVCINMLPYYQLPMVEKIHFIHYVKLHSYFRNYPNEYTLLFNLNLQRILIPLSNISFIIISFLYLLKKKKNQLVKPKISKIIRSLLYFFTINFVPAIMYLIYTSYHSPLPFDLAFRLPSTNHSELFSLFSILPILSLLMFPQLIYGFNPNNSLINFIKHFFNNIKNSKHEVEPLKFELFDDSEQIINYLEIRKPFLKTE